MSRGHIRLSILLIFLACCASFAIAQYTTPPKDSKEKGQVWVGVKPEEAYIYVDEKPVRHRNTTLNLTPGEHTITVYNYGYEPMTKKVLVEGGKYMQIDMNLKPRGGPVSGPWGRIQIEGVPGNSMVFLNGTSMEFYVGHADEMNNNFLAKQQLIVPAGKYQLFITDRRQAKTIWSGPIEVKANERAILYADRGSKDQKGKIVYKSWKDGEKMKAKKRFDAGTASATIVVAPVTAKLNADNQSVHCNQPATLSWSADNAAETTVTANNQKLADTPTGNLEVQPKETTKYELRAAGPGGIVTQDATVNVDNTVQTSLELSNPEVKYVKVGDTVKEQGTADLKWTASNADSVQIERIGTLNGSSGSQTIQATPQAQSEGPIDETQTYKITATNTCGGSDTKTVALHITGSIEPEQVAQAEPPPTLPQTATPLPLLALLGVVSLGAAAVLRRIGKR